MNAIAIANNDVAIVAWAPDQSIDGCLGFAVYRTDLRSGQTVPLPAWVGFKGQSNKDWKAQTTEVWPIQKFHWKDLTARRGGSYRYKIVPMLGTPGALKPHPTLSWDSNPIHLTPDRGGLSTYFNRGIFSTQSLAHQLPQGTDPAMFKVLRGRIDQPGDPLRLSLAGEIIEGVTSLVERARTTGGQCYAALYELNDTELVQRLLVSPFVHTILSNTGQADGTNRPARQGLEEAKVDLTSRMLPNGHIGHNKFVVYLDSTGTAKAVLSGSTNWTDTGLCGQANNAIVIENDELAAVYLDYWKRIKADTDAAGDDSKQLQAADYRSTNQTPHDVALADGSSVRVYFSPNTRQKTKSSGAATPVDLQEVFDRIAAAKQAVLFLAFEPGSPSIIDAIAKAQAANPRLFVRGAVTDPKASGDYTTQLFHLSGKKPDATVVPATAIKDQFSSWEHELLKDPNGFAIIHDKIVVIDPFSVDCVVVTGSHNLGYRASYCNDENLLIFTGKRALAEAYTSHILDVYDHYRFRFQVQQHGTKAWSGLDSTPTWQDKYFSADSPSRVEFAFWQGGIATTSGPITSFSSTVAGVNGPSQPSTPQDDESHAPHRQTGMPRAKKPVRSRKKQGG